MKREFPMLPLMTFASVKTAICIVMSVPLRCAGDEETPAGVVMRLLAIYRDRS